jgi:hypothetical protein
MNVQGRFKHLTRSQNTERPFLMMSVPYTETVHCGMSCSGPRRIRIIWRNSYIILHNFYYRLEYIVNICLEQIPWNVLLIGTLTWKCCKTSSSANGNNVVLRTTFDSNRMEHWHFTHSIIGNIFVRF